MKTRRRDRRWHQLRRAERKIFERDGISVVTLGRATVWDIGDLVRLREVAESLYARRQMKIGLDMSRVGLLPSGFMNMICEWNERGFEVLLYDPLPVVQNMLWFQQFTEHVSGTTYRLNYARPVTPESRSRRRESVNSSHTCRLTGSHPR